MSQKAFFSSFPLPEALTHRVISYLNVFRLLISLVLLFVFVYRPRRHAICIRQKRHRRHGPAFLFCHGGLPGLRYPAAENHSPTSIALATLFTDILFLSILLFIFGRLESGIAVLLIFTSASAAILLPLRMALFFASLVTLAFFGQFVFGCVSYEGASLTELIQAGLYGATTFAATIVGNLLSRWLKDYRLTAERQAVQLTRLEQVNELVIRRMRNGVLAVDDDGQIQLMNESAWFLLGSPKADQRNLATISPQLNRALADWYDNPAIEIEPMTMYGSQARVVPKFVSLPGSSSIRVLIFLEDNEVISQRAVEMSAHLLANLSGSIAHEIRNPLAAISHAAQLLEESEEIARIRPAPG